MPNRNKTNLELKAAAIEVEMAEMRAIMPGVLGGEWTVWADGKAVAIGLSEADVARFRQICAVEVPGVAP